MVQELADGRRLFRKIRSSKPSRARAEWRNLMELRALGFIVPEALVLARQGRSTAVVFLEVPGRPLDVLIAGCEEPESKLAFFSEVMRLCRKIHAAGFCYRDLYWAHLFAPGLGPSDGPPALVDVERAFMPKLRRRRWIVKDLASLLASWPAARPPRNLMLRLLRSYMAADFSREWKQLARQVLRRAEGIRSHRPRFGDMGFRL